MKGKKPAFTNSSTGYGKSRHSNNKSHNNNNNSGSSKSDKNCGGEKKDEKKPLLAGTEGDIEQEQDLNSGFGDYLRSSEAVEMMKLFVFANSIMLILTMAWPNIKEQYIWLMHWLNTLSDQ